MNKTTELGNIKWVVWLGILSSITAIITFLSGKNLPDFFSADPGATSTPYIVVVQPTSPALTVIEAASPTLLPTQEPNVNITGTWDLNFDYRGYTNSGDVFKERDATETWVINLWQTGSDVNGELVSVNAKYTDSCTKAYVEGTSAENNLSLFIHFNGTCCPNEIARIDGTIKGDQFFTGSYQPAKTPSGTCTLSTGEVTGIKQ